MTAAVGEGSPYKCGQVLQIKNVSIPNPKEILVVVVDEVKGFPQNKLNLHEKAFEALGSKTSVGTIKIEITSVLH
ncbi:RlpA-like double-psi beta-barrel domain-containing protein [Priestia abyssalis]|uniref:RlpA-like double-psi beta-barrel domain-containing protein n=1 Tax=Priestia abyssalis TaxID=1221450 RepID=UPI000994B2C6|nr:RlpA-like double-psi beta-barrel domain-containing protein [Priestia abyssalis]